MVAMTGTQYYYHHLFSVYMEFPISLLQMEQQLVLSQFSAQQHLMCDTDIIHFLTSHGWIEQNTLLTGIKLHPGCMQPMFTVTITTVIDMLW